MITPSPNNPIDPAAVDPTFAIDPEEYEAWLRAEETAAAWFDGPVPPRPPRRFNIRTLAQLRADTEARRAHEGSEYLIHGFIERQSLGVMVGDSGLGKSPLLYQAALCMAEGRPFLGQPVQQGRVLFLQCETGDKMDEKICSALARHVGASADPQNFLLWNLNACTEKWTLDDLIAEAKPVWVIMDPVKAFYPKFETDPSVAIEVYNILRALKKKFGCAITVIHHIKKPGDVTVPPLDGEDPKPWFVACRGAREIINGADVRLGLDVPSAGNPQHRVLAGFGHGGDIIHSRTLETVLDEHGEPLGFSVVSGLQLLTPDIAEFWKRLPEGEFRFGQAMTTYGKQNQATQDALNKCIRAGVVRKVTRGVYERRSATGGRSA
jgi:AAA domain